jgi:hypothetical protein
MYCRLRSIVRLILSLSLLPAFVTMSSAHAQTDQRCFPETNQCIAGRIREFWEQNGALSVFGFPITPQHEERIEGKPFQVQWFERNRLELHPENARPYDVLLGRLGADRLAQQARDPFTFPKSEPQPGCRFFPETGHNACGDILKAWHASGLEFDGKRGKSEAENLALFGLALSDAQTETIEGKEYTIQWFERARFELHPENQPPYNVLLGLLGNEVRSAGATPPPPGPSPGPAPLPPPSFNNCQADPNAASAPNYPIKIVTVDKGAETVRLQNVSPDAVNLDGWKMCSITGNQLHEGIGGSLAPGETKDFPHTNPGNIWNNSSSDPGALYNANGQLVSYWNN